MNRLYSKTEENGLDPRGVYIIQSENRLVIWIGSKIQGENETLYFIL